MGEVTVEPTGAAISTVPGDDAGGSMLPSLRRLAPQLLVAGVLPVVGYALLRPHVGSDTTALLAVLVFPLAEIGFERVHQGRFEPIGIIVLTGIVLGVIGSLAFGGSSTLLKVRESMLTGAFGVVCLGSLFAKRPIMFYLGRSFATGGDRAQMAAFDQRWDYPTVPHRFRLVTVVWGIGLIGEAVVRTILAVSISTQTFLIVAQVINWTVLGGLFWFSLLYSRAGEQQVAALVEAALLEQAAIPAAGLAASPDPATT
jgi:hypothetical protein